MEFYERLQRWRYGLEKVFENCRVETDWKGGKPKTRWALLAEYSPSHRETGEVRADGADGQVQENLQKRANYMKYFGKAGITASTEE